MPCAHFARALVTFAVAGLAVSCGRDAQLVKREHVARGDRFVAEKKYREAAVEYRNAIAKDERFGEARYKLAKAYAATNDADNALRQFTRAADLMPGDAAVQLDAAKALLLAGRFEDAKARAEGVLKADPKNVSAHILRASATAGLRDFESAFDAMKDAIELQPDRSASYVDLAVVEAVRGRPAEAEAAFRQAIAVDPRSVTARLALANYYWSLGRREEAEQQILKAVEAAPRDIAANRALASLYMITGRAEQAEAPLRAAVEASPDLELRLALADFYVAQRRPQDARPLLEALAGNKAAFAAAQSRLAGIEYAAGRRDDAHAMVGRVLAREPNNAQVLVVKAGWLLGERKLPEARAAAQAAIAADPRSVDAQAMLGSVQLARGDREEAIKAFTQVLTLKPTAFDAQLQLARLNLATGRTELGLQFAMQAVRTRPRDAAARLVLATAYLAQGDVTKAETELTPVLRAADHWAEAHTLLGLIEHRKGDAAAARRAYERALTLDPTAVDALLGIVNLDVAAKQLDQAQRRVDAQLAKVPDNAPLLLVAARAYATAGRWTDAETTLQKAVALDPSSMDAYRLLGELYGRQGRLDAARQEYERIVAARPNDVGARTLVGMLLQAESKTADARKEYEKILSINPRAAVAANNLAFMHADENGNLDVALNLAQTAKAELPEDPDVNDTLGWVYYKRNLPSLALEPLRFSVDKVPTNALYQYHLGLTYLKLGDTARARAALEEALKYPLDPEHAAQLRNTLASLQAAR